MCICHPFIESGISGSNNQHSILAFHKEKTVLLYKKWQWTPPTNVLESLVIHNSFLSDAYMDDIADLKYQLHRLHLEKYFNQQRHALNCQHLC